MSEEVEIVRRVYDAFSRRDAATVLACYDADIEWDSTGSPLTRLIGGGRVYRGHDGLRAFFREWHEAWEAVEYDCEEVIEARDHVISVDTMRGRGRASGAEVRLTHAAVWTIRNGRIVRVAWLPTRDDALKAVGLAEDEASSGTSELARRVIGALNRQDLSMLVSCADPDVEWHSFFARLGEVQVRVAGQGRISGVPAELPFAAVYTLQDGLVVRLRAYSRLGEALEAAGLKA